MFVHAFQNPFLRTNAIEIPPRSEKDFVSSKYITNFLTTEKKALLSILLTSLNQMA